MGSGYKDFAPGDVLAAADVDGYLMRQTMMTFADATTRDTALSGVLDEGMIAYLEDDKLVVVYNGTDWKVINSTEQTYGLVSYEVTGTFVKANYPWARSVKVRVVGGGGGGGGAGITGAAEVSSGGGGGGGGYAEEFQQISALAASETVTVGVGGVGAAGANGTAGVTSSFGAFVSASGGGFGQSQVAGAAPRTSGTAGNPGIGSGGDVNAEGGGGQQITQPATNIVLVPSGGSSALGGATRSVGSSSTVSFPAVATLEGHVYGGGGGGGGNAANEATAATGGTGADGIVIVELFG